MMTPEQLTGKVVTHLNSITLGAKSFLVHQEVAADLLLLREAAIKAGFNFHIASGFRDFERQRLIWNRKFSGESVILDDLGLPLMTSDLSDEAKIFSILRWSALPGASRHHWGSDFDIYDRDSIPEGVTLTLEPWEYIDGHQHHFYQWLQGNIQQFGFYFPYAQDRGGVAFEPWHISHIHVSKQCLQQLTCKILTQQLAADPILGNHTVHKNLDKIYNQFITNIISTE
jgi:LAS superfamily LD-carboxypeptidase LdcB